MVTTKLNLSMTEPQVRQIYAKQGDTGRVLDITLDQTPEDGTLRILRPDGVEVTSEAVTGGEIESGGTFESLTEADVTELTVGIEPVQDLNGFDKPWVGGAGKNKLNPDFIQGSALDLGSPSRIVSQYGVPVEAGKTYTFSADDYTNFMYVLNSSATDGLPLTGDYSYCGTPTAWTASDITFTATNNGFVYVVIRKPNNFGLAPSGVASVKMQFEEGSSATEYSPYSNICPITGHDEVTVYFGAEQGTADETYTTSLGQTVYGGTLDMVTGVLTITHKIINCNGSEQWGMVSSGYFTIPKTNLDSELSTTEVYSDTMICNGLPWLFSQPNTTASFNAITHSVRVSMPSITTLSDFRTYLSNNNLQFVLELAEPQTYQLTPQQIKTLVGTNNVWASSGQIVNIKFTYGGLLSELPSDATSVVGKCYCDVEQNGVSSMPFTLNVKKNERQ